MKPKRAGLVENSFICLVLLFLLLPGALGIIEKGDFVKSYGFREKLNTFSQNLRFFILHDKLFNYVYTDDGSWWDYVENRAIDDYQNTIPFTEAELSTLQAKLDYFETLLAEQGIKLYVLIAPNKPTIYPEAISVDFKKKTEVSRLDQLLEYQMHHGHLKLIDVRPVLLQNKAKLDLYQTAGTHWTTLGSYFGYQALFGRISMDFPGMTPRDLSEYVLVNQSSDLGDLPRRAGNLAVPETFVALELINKPSIRYSTIDNMICATNTNLNLPTAVIYRDSFFTALIEHVTPHFSEVVMISSFIVEKNLIDTENPDIVILEYAERFLDRISKLPSPP